MEKMTDFFNSIIMRERGAKRIGSLFYRKETQVVTLEKKCIQVFEKKKKWIKTYHTQLFPPFGL